MLLNYLDRAHTIQQAKERYSFETFVLEAALDQIAYWKAEYTGEDDELEIPLQRLIDECSLNTGGLDINRVLERTLANPSDSPYSDIHETAVDKIGESLACLLSEASHEVLQGVVELTDGALFEDGEYAKIKRGRSMALSMIPLVRLLTYVSSRGPDDAAGSIDFNDAPERNMAYRIHLMPPQDAAWVCAIVVDIERAADCAVLYHGQPVFMPQTNELLLPLNTTTTTPGTTQLILMLWTREDPQQLLDGWLNEIVSTIDNDVDDEAMVYGFIMFCMDKAQVRSIGWHSNIGVVYADDMLKEIGSWPEGAAYQPLV